MDSWDGYRASRARIQQGWVSRGVRNPVVLTGDVHRAWASNLMADYNNANSAVIGSELVTSSATSGGDGDGATTIPDVGTNPWLKFFNNRRGYVRTTMSPTELRADFRARGEGFGARRRGDHREVVRDRRGPARPSGRVRGSVMKKKLFAAAVAVLFTATIASPAAHAAIAAPTWSTANSVSTGDQDAPAIATNRNGYVAVVWEDDRDTTAATDNAHSEIYLRLFRNGAAVYEKKLSAGGGSGVTNWRHLHPDVGLDDKGNAVVVWADDPDGNGYYNVPYRVVNTAGTVTASGSANSSSDGQQINPRVAVDPDGAPAGGAVAFSVVWEDIQTGAQAMVKAAGFTGPTTRAWEVTASQTTGQHHNPDIAVSASGDALVVWNEDGDADAAYNVGWLGSRGRMARSCCPGVRRTPTSVGSRRTRRSPLTSTATSLSPGSRATPVLRAPGRAASTHRHGALRRRGGGCRRQEPIGRHRRPGQRASGGLCTAADLDVWVRGFSSAGTTDAARLSAQRLSQLTALRQEQMAVAVSPWSEVAVAYTDDNDGNTYDQVMLGQGISNSNW